ncbi:Apo-citrate lyase phosphoribosyl-dephospho-CoA transferase [Companilactobacillus paralimentarius]|uniref:citrate lyase holo-[acyl-carrier protein] synthase n=1 Tax=Companilactobacillus paralimentarius TaxID=83526 RepID=UPI00384EAE01
MIDIFSKGISQDITQILKSRDMRVKEQLVLLKKLKSNQSLINAKLNIPGPIKNNTYLIQVFCDGLKRFLQESKVDYQLIWDVATGPEAFLILNESAETSKQTAIEFEDNDNLGRLFDIDVLTENEGVPHPLSRNDFHQAGRKCIMCNQPAKVCARSRKHSVKEMQNYINELINKNMELL